MPASAGWVCYGRGSLDIGSASSRSLAAAGRLHGPQALKTGCPLGDSAASPRQLALSGEELAIVRLPSIRVEYAVSMAEWHNGARGAQAM